MKSLAEHMIQTNPCTWLPMMSTISRKVHCELAQEGPRCSDWHINTFNL